MLPQPLHPAVVHFPIVFAVLLPLVALAGILIIWRGVPVKYGWIPVVAVSAALAATSWVAVETGEQEEDAVERVMPEAAIHEHEERAEIFLPLSVFGLLVVSAGLLHGRPGRVMRGASLALALGLTYVGYQVGHTGGALVYEYGAANAYTLGANQGGEGRDSGDGEGRAHEDENEDRP